MDLDLTSEQVALEDAVAKLLARHGTGERLLVELDEAGYLDVVRDAGPIEGVLVVERAAEALAVGPVAARVLVGPLMGVGDLPPAVGLVDGASGSLCRWAPHCEAFLVLDGSRALLAGRADVDVTPVETAFGAPYGRVTVRGGDEIGSGDRLRRAWQVAIAAEAEGTMLAAIAKTAQHVLGAPPVRPAHRRVPGGAAPPGDGLRHVAGDTMARPPGRVVPSTTSSSPPRPRPTGARRPSSPTPTPTKSPGPSGSPRSTGWSAGRSACSASVRSSGASAPTPGVSPPPAGRWTKRGRAHCRALPLPLP